MEKNILYIKNMVCGRCILTVENILNRLEIPFEKISLGEVVLERSLSKKETEGIEKELQPVGFEVLGDRSQKLVNRIKSLVIRGIYEERNFSNKNLSVILNEELHMDYSYLSSLFSKMEGKSIQHFQQEIKTERVKELLEYNELTISEIAIDLGYSSPAYLSTQFKKSTGFTPSNYRIHHQKRNSLDEY